MWNREKLVSALSVAKYGENLPILLSRAVLGYGFYMTGSGKLRNLDGLVSFFTGLGIPLAEYQAPFVAGLEYVGGLALIVGLLVRPLAFMLAATMTVALLTADRQQFLGSWTSSSDIVPTEVTAFAYLLLLLWLVFRGGGVLSLDFALWRVAQRRYPSLAERAKPLSKESHRRNT